MAPHLGGPGIEKASRNCDWAVTNSPEALLVAPLLARFLHLQEELLLALTKARFVHWSPMSFRFPPRFCFLFLLLVSGSSLTCSILTVLL